MESDDTVRRQCVLDRKQLVFAVIQSRVRSNRFANCNSLEPCNVGHLQSVRRYSTARRITGF